MTNPELRDFASRLMAREGKGEGDSGKEEPVAFRVCDKLRRPLSKLMGLAAFGALVSRALTLAKADAPELGAVQVAADGSLNGLSDMKADHPDGAAECEIVLVARLLGLLVTFIGAGFTLSLVQGIWPDVSLDDLNAETENKR